MTVRRPIDRRTVLGSGAFIISSAQYFIAQVVTASAWEAPAYSWNDNYISDLGNTTCGPFRQGGQTLEVCSPLHALMNGSFMTSGVLTIIGAVTLGPTWPHNRTARAATALLVVAGVQKLLIGLFPEDTVPALHAVGALNLLTADVAILLLALGISKPDGRNPIRRHRVLAVLSTTTAALGLLALLALPLTRLTGLPLPGLGTGGAERVAAYPSNIWPLAVGLLLLQSGRVRASGRHVDVGPP